MICCSFGFSAIFIVYMTYSEKTNKGYEVLRTHQCILEDDDDDETHHNSFREAATDLTEAGHGKIPFYFIFFHIVFQTVTEGKKIN